MDFFRLRFSSAAIQSLQRWLTCPDSFYCAPARYNNLRQSTRNEQQHNKQSPHDLSETSQLRVRRVRFRGAGFAVQGLYFSVLWSQIYDFRGVRARFFCPEHLFHISIFQSYTCRVMSRLHRNSQIVGIATG